jgi:opacity protein-like surface antigen
MTNNVRCSTTFACFLSLICGVALFGKPAKAADLKHQPGEQLIEPASKQWEFRFTPYAWATSVNGNSTVAGQTVDVDASFLDIVEDSESILALMGYFEARRGGLAFYTDVVWSSLTFNGQRSATGPLGGLNVSVNGELDYEQTIIEAGISYEIARFSREAVSLKDDLGVPTSYTAIDVLAGARYWRESVGVSLDITGMGPGVLPPGFQVSGNRVIARSGATEWIDPVVGLRVRHQFSPGQELQLRGDIGGFGVGSDFSWQLFGGYSFQLAESWSGVVGYRALSVDFSEEASNGTRGIDLLQHGPVIGVNFRW